VPFEGVFVPNLVPAVRTHWGALWHVSGCRGGQSRSGKPEQRRHGGDEASGYEPNSGPQWRLLDFSADSSGGGTCEDRLRIRR
jgi:hypothetical protein